jgi:hypothetical protein
MKRLGRTKRSRKARRLTRHHIVNKVDGGDNHISNIIKLTRERHTIWHTLFRNLDIDGAIALLQRVKRIKASQKEW